MKKIIMLFAMVLLVIGKIEAGSRKKQHRKGIRVHLATRAPRS